MKTREGNELNAAGGNLRNILKKAWQKRRDYIEGNDIMAYRLVTKEEMGWASGTGLPVAVDIYTGETNKAAVIQIYDADVNEKEMMNLEDILAEDFQIGKIFYKKRYRVKEDIDAGGELNEKAVEMVVEENEGKFLINLNNYLDTGLFLDHREARKWVKSYVAKKVAENDDFTVLNLFAYTGSFSVYAAQGGAKMTHTVDLSKTYCDWARRNFELNGMAREMHWIYRMDTFEFYKYAARKGLLFDLIILDPPTFSRNKGQNFSVQRDHFDLIKGAASLLKPEGEILFSNNCLDFELDRRLENGYIITNTQSKTVPLDFKVEPEDAGYDATPQIHNSYLIRKA